MDPSVGSSPGTTAWNTADVDWWTVLAELDERRCEVLMAGDPTGIDDYAAPASPAWQADEAMLDDLAGRGVRPVGLRSRVLAIEAVATVDAGAQLRIVDLRSGYDLVDVGTGARMEHVEPAGAARWTITLAPAGTRDTEGASGGPAGTRSSGSDPASSRAGTGLAWRVVSVSVSD